MEPHAQPDVRSTEEPISQGETSTEVVGSLELMEEALRLATPVTICSQNVTDD